MFWRKNQVAVLSEKPIAVATKEKSALDIYKETILTNLPDVNNHMGKITKLSIPSLSMPMPKYMRQSLALKGFYVYVNSSWINNFKYHASVYSECSSHLLNTVYMGDIPESVLNKALMIREMGMTYITIHSNNPLPVRFVNCDPVLIGWGNAILSVSGEGSSYIHTDKEGKLLRPASESTEGIIIAIWDMDKEFPLSR